MEFLQQLRVNNNERQKLWDPDNKLDLSFKALEFSGEAGELASKVKKLVRQELGVVGSRINIAEIEEEVADVLITLDLLCSKLNIDIEKVTKDKFNIVSRKNNFDVLFEDVDINVQTKTQTSITNNIYERPIRLSPNPLIPFCVKVDGNHYILYRRKYSPLTDRQIWEKLEHCYGLTPIHQMDPFNPFDIDENDFTIGNNTAISRHEPFMNGLDYNLYIVKFDTDNQQARFLFLSPNAETIKQYLSIMTRFTNFTWDKVNRQYMCIN